MTSTPPSPTTWRKATASQSQGCVELALFPGALAIRDSKNPDGPKLLLSRDAWRKLTDRVNSGELDL